MSVKLLEDQNDVKHCMSKLEYRSQITPDFPDRRKECNIPVFVYGFLGDTSRRYSFHFYIVIHWFTFLDKTSVTRVTPITPVLVEYITIGTMAIGMGTR